MGLKTYLAKRAVHTFITISIVLLLMFVLFRLMPGDPTIFFIQPGITPIERERLKVEFGFARWEDAPGVYKEGSIAAIEEGLYSITVNLEDSAGNNATLYAAYVKAKTFPIGSPLVISRILATPSMNVLKGTNIALSVLVVSSSAGLDLSTLNVWANVTAPSSALETVPLSYTEPAFNGTYVSDEIGIHQVDVFALNPETGDMATSAFGFAVNPTDEEIAPFYYVTDEDPRGTVVTFPSVYTADIGQVRVIVQSEEGSIEVLKGTVVSPGGERSTFDLSHPKIAVDVPDYEEFAYYYVGMLTGEFGTSFTSRRPVIAEINEKVWPSLLLFGTALVLSVLIGIGIGALLAWYRGSKREAGAIVVSLFFYSMPVFWFGLILLWAFAFILGLFPLGGFGGVNERGERLHGIAYILDVLHHMTLPLLNLLILTVAFYLLLMRNSMMEVLGEDFIITARAKGLSERTVMYRHAARNAMLPVVTVVAIAMAGVVSGGVLTETIFSWPGMGRYLVVSTLNQDFPAVQAAFFILALITILGNVVADVAYAYLDPRVRL
ncbi:MAG: ABC transporter permease subunit [Candidatus Geothermarchaeales archaeon]